MAFASARPPLPTIAMCSCSRGHDCMAICTSGRTCAFSPKGSETVIVPQRKTDVTEEEAKILVLKGGTTIGEVVRGLNAIGVTPRDLIAILQAIKAAGALQGELEIL